jgi:hypothetical protein
MEVSGGFRDPATFPLGKNPNTNCIGGWVGITAGLHGYGEENVCKDAKPGPSGP